jgi:hypothetical protein
MLSVRLQKHRLRDKIASLVCVAEKSRTSQFLANVADVKRK